MNAYALRTIGEVKVISETEIYPAEYGLICEIVIAETSGKAKSKVCSDYGLPFTTRFSIRKLASDVDIPDGNIISGPDEYHNDYIAMMVHASVIENDMSEAEEWQQWVGWEYGGITNQFDLDSFEPDDEPDEPNEDELVLVGAEKYGHS